MGAGFAELAASETDIGLITLRRRLEPRLGVDVYEVKLDDEFLMSSLFTVAEIELTRLGLAAFDTGTEAATDGLDVAVGGLGLGYTAKAALDDQRVRSLTIVEAVDAVIEWHEADLLPDTTGLASDPRTRFVHGDFFALVDAGNLDPAASRQRFHAILLDIDHSPRNLLHDRHGAFYSAEGLRSLLRLLHPAGVFALWSDDPPDEEFLADLRTVFASAEAHVVAFPNPYTHGESTNTVYVATT